MLDEVTAHGTLPWQLALGLVHVDEKPSLFALYRQDPSPGRVVAWAMALPAGAAVVVPVDRADNRPILTTLRGVRRRWAPALGASLVQVRGRSVLHLAT